MVSLLAEGDKSHLPTLSNRRMANAFYYYDFLSSSKAINHTNQLFLIEECQMHIDNFFY